MTLLDPLSFLAVWRRLCGACLGGFGLTMAPANGKRFAGVSWSEAQVRNHGSAALRYAMKKELATQEDVASWCRPRLKSGARLVRKWLKGESLITFAVFGSARLRPHLLEYLKLCDRRVRKTLPRVARRRAG